MGKISPLFPVPSITKNLSLTREGSQKSKNKWKSSIKCLNSKNFSDKQKYLLVKCNKIYLLYCKKIYKFEIWKFYLLICCNLSSSVALSFNFSFSKHVCRDNESHWGARSSTPGVTCNDFIPPALHACTAAQSSSPRKGLTEMFPTSASAHFFFISWAALQSYLFQLRPKAKIASWQFQENEREVDSNNTFFKYSSKIITRIHII